MLSDELIALLGEKGRGGDIARLQQAIENANYEGREDDDEWIIADAMRQNEEVGGSTLTEQELRHELGHGDEDEDEDVDSESIAEAVANELGGEERVDLVARSSKMNLANGDGTRWITIGGGGVDDETGEPTGGGRRVQIDGQGRILKGLSKNAQGKTLDEAFSDTEATFGKKSDGGAPSAASSQEKTDASSAKYGAALPVPPDDPEEYERDGWAELEYTIVEQAIKDPSVLSDSIPSETMKNLSPALVHFVEDSGLYDKTEDGFKRNNTPIAVVDNWIGEKALTARAKEHASDEVAQALQAYKVSVRNNVKPIIEDFAKKLSESNAMVSYANPFRKSGSSTIAAKDRLRVNDWGGIDYLGGYNKGKERWESLSPDLIAGLAASAGVDASQALDQMKRVEQRRNALRENVAKTSEARFRQVAEDNKRRARSTPTIGKPRRPQ